MKRKTEPSAPRATATDKWIAVFTGVLTAVSIYQGWLTQTGLQESGNDTREALEISRRAAVAAEKQSHATEVALNAYNRLAGATERQAQTSERQAATSEKMSEYNRAQAEAASKQLALNVAPNVDVDIHVQPYTKGSSFTADGVIANRGSYTIRGATLAISFGLMMGRPGREVWAKLFPETMKIDIVPGVDHHIPFKTPPLRSDAEWQALADKRASVFFAARVSFKDAGGMTRQVQQCVFVSGPYAGTPGYSC